MRVLNDNNGIKSVYIDESSEACPDTSELLILRYLWQIIRRHLPADNQAQERSYRTRLLISGLIYGPLET